MQETYATKLGSHPAVSLGVICPTSDTSPAACNFRSAPRTIRASSTEFSCDGTSGASGAAGSK